MKKIFTLIMCAMIFCAGVLPASASAYTPANLEGQEQIQYMDDGSYFITIIETEKMTAFLLCPQQPPNQKLPHTMIRME